MVNPVGIDGIPKVSEVTIRIHKIRIAVVDADAEVRRVSRRNPWHHQYPWQQWHHHSKSQDTQRDWHRCAESSARRNPRYPNRSHHPGKRSTQWRCRCRRPESESWNFIGSISHPAGTKNYKIEAEDITIRFHKVRIAVVAVVRRVYRK